MSIHHCAESVVCPQWTETVFVTMSPFQMGSVSAAAAAFKFANAAQPWACSVEPVHTGYIVRPGTELRSCWLSAQSSMHHDLTL